MSLGPPNGYDGPFHIGEKMNEPKVRAFDTGATRSADTGKPDYEGYLSPLVIKEFGVYMTKHRNLPDGTVRSSDNWQKGIPQDQYIKSLWRHFHDLWTLHRGYVATDQLGQRVSLRDTLSAVLFNIQGYFHEHLKRDIPERNNTLESLQSHADARPAHDQELGTVRPSPNKATHATPQPYVYDKPFTVATAREIIERTIAGDSCIAAPPKGIISNVNDGYSSGPVTLSEDTSVDPHSRTLRTQERRNAAGRIHMDEILMKLGCPLEVRKHIVGGLTVSMHRNPCDSPKYAYVAGPMRGLKDFNFPAFDEARDVLLKDGWNVISPADIDRAAKDVFATTGTYSCEQSDFAFRDFYSLYFLSKINPTRKNGICLLPGWSNSKGAAGEFFMGRWMGLSFYKIVNRATSPEVWGMDTDSLLHIFASNNKSEKN